MHSYVFYLADVNLNWKRKTPPDLGSPAVLQTELFSGECVSMSKGGVSRRGLFQKRLHATNTHTGCVLETRLESLRYTIICLQSLLAVYLGSSVTHAVIKGIVH